jgi:hypothetical protein
MIRSHIDFNELFYWLNKYERLIVVKIDNNYLLTCELFLICY